MERMVAAREKARPAMQDWKDASMLTLTVDRSPFDSPRDAFEHVQAERGVANMMRQLDRWGHLHSRRYLCALEFHNDPEGWPHWHVIVESGFIQHDAIVRAWKEGNCWISRSKSMDSVAHALHYVTKYISKVEGFPDWILDYEKQLKRFSTSRGFYGSTRHREPKKTERTRKVRTIRERQEFCKSESQIFDRKEVMGGVQYKYVATVQTPYVEEFSEANGQDVFEIVHGVAAVDEILDEFGEADCWGADGLQDVPF